VARRTLLSSSSDSFLTPEEQAKFAEATKALPAVASAGDSLTNATPIFKWALKEAFFLGKMGYANAISVLLLIATVGLGVLQIRYSRSQA
jgi:ABC-type sugar transport system permease subunit